MRGLKANTGRYRVKVVNKRNNASSEEKFSEICRVTDDPNAPIIKLYNGTEEIVDGRIDSANLHQLKIMHFIIVNH